eukprot:6153381-Pyramimonas_sp.AAC.1
MKAIKEFFKKPDPKELVRKWQSQLRAEGRGVDRQIREIQREEKKVEKSIKECAKRNDIASAKLSPLKSVALPAGGFTQCSARKISCSTHLNGTNQRIPLIFLPDDLCFVQLLARELVQSRRTTTRLATNKVRLELPSSPPLPTCTGGTYHQSTRAFYDDQQTPHKPSTPRISSLGWSSADRFAVHNFCGNPDYNASN